MGPQRHLNPKAVKVVATKKAADLLSSEKWALVAWCMQYYDIDKQKMMPGSYREAEKYFGSHQSEV